MIEAGSINSYFSGEELLTKVRFRVALAFLFLMGFVLYLPAIQSGLSSDDWGLSYPEPTRAILKSFHGHWFGGGTGELYRPLTRVFIWAQGHAFGYNGFYQHLVGLALFYGTILVFSYWARILAGRIAATLFVAICIVNPLNVETVSWISSQTDTVSLFFVTLAFHFAILFFLRNRYLHFSLLIVTSILAFLAKESAIVFSPVVILASIILFYSNCLDAPARRRLVIVSVGSIVLTLVYLLARYWFLGQIGSSGLIDSTHIPSKDFPYHQTKILAGILNSYQSVLGYPTFPASGSTEYSDYRWVLVLGALALLFLLITKSYLLLFLALSAFVCLTPALIVEHPFFYVPMVGSYRYLYATNFFLSLFAAITLSRVVQKFRDPIYLVFMFVLLLPALYNAGRSTTIAVGEWERAGSIRNQLTSSLNDLRPPAAQATIVYGILPDSSGGSFIFRNGFTEYMKLIHPNFFAIKAANFSPNLTSVTLPIYKLEFQSGKFELSRWTAAESALAAKAVRSHAIPPKMPIDFNFASKSTPSNDFGKSPDLVVLDSEREPLLTEISGGDPYLVFPWTFAFSHARYDRLVVTFEYFPPKASSKGGNEIWELLWQPKNVTLTGLPYLSRNVSVGEGIQSIVFDIGQSMEWVGCSEISFFRLDVGSAYRGKLRIHRVQLE